MSVSTIKIETDLITLMKVLDKTGNPTVAIQILNGTYQEPEFCKADRASSPNKKDGTKDQFIFESYDIWTDIVHYKAPEHYWSREMSRAQWEKLELWSDYEIVGEDVEEDSIEN
jgi:hypothetical protein